MNIKFLASIVVFSCSAFLHAEDPLITAAIRSSNVEELGKLLMPGTYIRLQDKKSYAVFAQQKTKEAFMHLKAFSFADVKLGIAALLKLGSSLTLGYAFYKKIEQDESQEKIMWNNVKSEVIGKFLEGPMGAFYGILDIVKNNSLTFTYLSGLGYIGYKGIEDVRALIQKDDRFKRYVHALSIEGLIARVPVFEQ